MSIDQNRAKSLITSKTFWGVVMMTLGVFVPEYQGVLDGSVDNILSVVGGVLAIYGRIKAVRPIGGVFTNGEGAKSA